MICIECHSLCQPSQVAVKLTRRAMGSPSPNCHSDISFGKTRRDFSDRTAGVGGHAALCGSSHGREEGPQGAGAASLRPSAVQLGKTCLTCENEEPADRKRQKKGILLTRYLRVRLHIVKMIPVHTDP
ncbi:hypothetical protein DPX16_9439 [Anabarilius grahami]|uniref:Uncharacterized protein n=1 Tax=Anabarilius grahami TaxID=495550 RepID=A0A3N0Y7S4_ANAGA|nr:hypothetical protein DPX16_9439 [Anabarilius grahami]